MNVLDDIARLIEVDAGEHVCMARVARWGTAGAHGFGKETNSLVVTTKDRNQVRITMQPVEPGAGFRMFGGHAEPKAVNNSVPELYEIESDVALLFWPGNPFHGWLFDRLSNGEWHSYRQLTPLHARKAEKERLVLSTDHILKPGAQ